MARSQASTSIPADPRKQEVLERWFRAIRSELLTRYGTAGDLNVSEMEEVIPLCRDIGIGHPQIGVLRGHFGLDGEALGRRSELMHIGLDQPVPPEYGLAGKEARVFALVTGYSVTQSALCAAPPPGKREPSDTRVLLQGFGSVGGAAALYMVRAGFRLVGIVDARGCLLHEEGFSVDEVERAAAPSGGEHAAGGGAELASRCVSPAQAFFDTPSRHARRGGGIRNSRRRDTARPESRRQASRSIVAGANHPFAADDVPVTRAWSRMPTSVSRSWQTSSQAVARRMPSRARAVPTSLCSHDIVFESIEATVAETPWTRQLRRAGNARAADFWRRPSPWLSSGATEHRVPKTNRSRTVSSDLTAYVRSNR